MSSFIKLCNNYDFQRTYLELDGLHQQADCNAPEDIDWFVIEKKDADGSHVRYVGWVRNFI